MDISHPVESAERHALPFRDLRRLARRGLTTRTHVRSLRLVAVASVHVFIATAPLAAQPEIQPQSKVFWLGGAAAIITSLALDDELQRVAIANQSPSLDRAARMLNPLGQAHNLLPALALAYTVPRLTGHRTIADAMLRVGLGYAVADGVESILKPVVGRHRPDSTRSHFRFRPLNGAEAWHSFPSGHTVHAFSIAAAVATETRQPWLAMIAYGTASAVGLQRIYGGAHWASDVAASAVLAIAASSTTVHWLRACGLGPLLAPVKSELGNPRCTILGGPGRVAIELVF